MINLLLLLVYLLIWLFFQLEPPGTTWNQLKFGWTWFQWNQLEIHFRLESRWKIWRVFPAYLAGTVLRKFWLEPVGHSKDLGSSQIPRDTVLDMLAHKQPFSGML